MRKGRLELHPLRDWILSPARLPIPPLSRVSNFKPQRRKVHVRCSQSDESIYVAVADSYLICTVFCSRLRVLNSAIQSTPLRLDAESACV